MIVSHDVDGPADGPAVVLLHSSVCDRRMWDAQRAPLAAAGHRVVRLDFRTCGDSPAATAPYSDEGDVLAVLDALGIERAALVGSSYGGRVALRLAAQHPDRVDRLVLLCPGVPGMQPTPDITAFDEAEEVLLDAGDLLGAAELNARTWLGPEADDATRALVRDMQLHNFEAGAGADWELELPEPEVGLGAVRVPASVFGGAHDLPGFREVSRTLAERLPEATYTELSWAGHLPALERPDEITQLILSQLR
ncbi:alpha/beta hydrolase [Streptomyces venezuelae]|uniref:Alpha/beta hydrolase n=1 Tax=Streptomyces venezuelae TaxID=54571 RepID=A0A5P2D4W4_STRVZ|nr:alpha/beta hydrolase [Streptomyces venezuelae]QES49773.1 alpha/beta hydrolase [Streptomyces venezuelae]